MNLIEYGNYLKSMLTDPNSFGQRDFIERQLEHFFGEGAHAKYVEYERKQEKIVSDFFKNIQ